MSIISCVKHFTVITNAILFTSFVSAQEFIGLRTDNYAGSNGMLLNPAAPLAGKLPWDINLFAAGVAEDNNYISIPEPFFQYISTADSIIDVQYFHPEKVYGHGSVLAQLPSGFVQFGDFAAGIYFTGRSAGYFHADKHPPSTTGFKGIPLYTPTDMPAFKSGIMVWTEVGVNGGMTLERNSLFSLHMGVNLKYLIGFEGLAFENNSLFTFTKDTVNMTVSHFDADYDYTRNLGSNLLFDPRNYSINGKGVGADVGFYYELHKRSKFNYSKHLDYRWKFGASLLDVGYIKYTENSGSYHLEETEQFIVSLVTLDSIDDIDEYNRTGSRLLYDLSTASQDGSEFTLWLPSAFTFSVDRNFNNSLFVNLLYVQRIPHIGTNLIARANTISITPRYEKRDIGLALPLTLYEYKEFRFGIAARLWFVTIGSDNLLPFMYQKDYSSVNLYAGIKINPYWLVREDKKRFLECLKNISLRK